MYVCVLIAVILGEAENDEEDLFESSRARFCYDSAWSYRHLVCLKGKRKITHQLQRPSTNSVTMMPTDGNFLWSCPVIGGETSKQRTAGLPVN
ncbi:hypothetical protein CesoFtcFv8_017407 [Champsocephalus esox]|uniref:Uncharacterized protein n=1 Tax=Champsocephalus esox TaxID=159716 RepID=A0AAN8BKM5_9TELE|nr:hypothetical protein CesoFtcFv8_017407 [Champsocephalus esox]